MSDEKEKGREKTERRRDGLSEQRSASKEERESVIKEKRINEFTSCKKQQTAHVLKPCSGRGGSELLMLSFSHQADFSVNVSDSFTQYVVCKCNNHSVELESDLLTKRQLIG